MRLGVVRRTITWSWIMSFQFGCSALQDHQVVRQSNGCNPLVACIAGPSGASLMRRSPVASVKVPIGIEQASV